MKKIILALSAVFTISISGFDPALFAASEDTSSFDSQLVFLDEPSSDTSLSVVDVDSLELIKRISLEGYNNVSHFSLAGRYMAFTANFNTEAYLLNMETNEFTHLAFIDPQVGVIEGLALTPDARGIAWTTSQVSYLGWLSSKLFVSDIDGLDVQNVLHESYQYQNSPSNSFAAAPIQWSSNNASLYFEKFVFDDGRSSETDQYPCFEHLYRLNVSGKYVEKISRLGECITDISENEQKLGVKIDGAEAWNKALKIRNTLTGGELMLDAYGESVGNLRFNDTNSELFGFASFEEDTDPKYNSEIGGSDTRISLLKGINFIDFINNSRSIGHDENNQFVISKFTEGSNETLLLDLTKFIGTTSKVSPEPSAIIESVQEEGTHESAPEEVLILDITDENTTEAAENDNDHTGPDDLYLLGDTGPALMTEEEIFIGEVLTQMLDATATGSSIDLEIKSGSGLNLLSELNTGAIPSSSNGVGGSAESVVADYLANNKRFSDLIGSAYQTEIEYLQALGIVQGYDDGTYRPESSINRAEFTKIIIKSRYKDDEIVIDTIGDEVVSCFPDVLSDHWFFPFVCFAQHSTIIAGYPDGNFIPANYINAAEALKIVIETFGIDVSDYIDEDADWYGGYWNFAVAQNVLPADVSNPDQLINRGQMAFMIFQMLHLK